jgi:hypothetical protein
MLPYQSGFDDFYNSMQDGFDANEGFGKKVRQQQQQQTGYTRGFKKILSVENFHGMQGYEKGFKKSSSTNGFEDHEYDCQNYKKSKLGFVHEDQSTVSSLSPFNSMSSLSSMNGVTHSKSKTKFNGGNKKKVNNSPAETDFRVKYKTEVCKYWAEYGTCEFGDQCAFAHGKQEIRQKLHISNNYKTKKCVQFHENGLCPYGLRCQFIHCARTDPQLNSIQEKGSYASDLDSADMWCNEDPDCVCMRRKNRTRLPCMVKMSNEHVCEHN